MFSVFNQIDTPPNQFSPNGNRNILADVDTESISTASGTFIFNISKMFRACVCSIDSTQYFVIVQDEDTHGVDVTPRLKRYLRDRKSFMQLGTPDVATPRRAKLNLEFGQQTVANCQRKIASLQQTIRRLRSKLSTMEETIRHLQAEGHISEEVADTLSVRLKKRDTSIPSCNNTRTSSVICQDYQIRSLPVTNIFILKNTSQVITYS